MDSQMGNDAMNCHVKLISEMREKLAFSQFFKIFNFLKMTPLITNNNKISERAEVKTLQSFVSANESAEAKIN